MKFHVKTPSVAEKWQKNSWLLFRRTLHIVIIWHHTKACDNPREDKPTQVVPCNFVGREAVPYKWTFKLIG